MKMATELRLKGALLLALPMAFGAQAETPSEATADGADSAEVGKILVISHPIFDESDPDTFFIHRWANFLHINTRESTVKSLLSFNEADAVTQKDLDEAQRLLRAEPYLRDATIKFAEKDPDADEANGHRDVVVETWDNWSLLPTVSASHNGGDTKYSFGIKEDNLLGTGIKTRLKYQSERDRTGYKVAFDIPLTIVPHGRLAADFYDNSDGEAAYLYFDRPFYTLDGKLMYSAEVLHDKRTDTLRQNGVEVNEFSHSVDYINLRYGWLSDKNSDHLTRWIIGVTEDKHSFEPTNLYPAAELPTDRDFLYPWIGWQYIQDDYRVLRNVHLINYNEDFNLGWQHYFTAGLEVQDTDGDVPGVHLSMASSRGFASEDSLLLLWLKGRATLNTTQKDNYQLQGIAEYFYQINPKWTAYGKAVLGTSNNTYGDVTIALGDETGLRGYPNDYQHGDHHWLVSAEIRNYPNINLYQLAELGWAAFIDVGQAFGGPEAELNETRDPIASIGIGARIYSSRSSYGNIAHIDLTVPFGSGEHVDSWEWRFLVKNHF
ncbi:conserved hypothetical protein [Shewanella amazonensis SB2B]|uniref:Haemolysin activator HlyB C-terminal domain-containing protein n=2 Tax=Shewanella amazonensis TaxID=60478 RepID=A1SAZ8_SHEAM|nr:conserved hypothetical protein [Shewanella amazonensis SB2B]